MQRLVLSWAVAAGDTAMPSTGVTVTTTAQNLVSALSLSNGKSYAIQNESGGDILYAEAASAPAATFLYWKRIGEKEEYIVKPASGMGIWVKTRGGESLLSVNDA